MGILADLEALAAKAETFLGGFFSTVVSAEVTALAPIAQATVVNLSSELAASGGNLEAFGNAAGKALQAAGAQAAAAGIEAGGAALLSAVGSAIASLQPSVTTSVTATVAAPTPLASSAGS